MSATEFAIKRIGTLNRFYTQSAVGQLLAEQLDELNPNSVIDLGAGEGSLSASVAQRWPTADYVTVDKDVKCISSLAENISESGAQRHTHYTNDVLESSLDIKPAHGLFDLAVCNPPFFKPPWRQEFSDILLNANLSDSVSASDVTAELIFLAQNLNMLKLGGTIALITPDGMMTGNRTIALRRALIRQHRIEAVIQLPNNAFKDTDAYCFILILKKGLGATKSIKLLKYDKIDGLLNPIYIDSSVGERRLDYDFHLAHKSLYKEATTLRQLGAEIRRGSLSTVEARSKQFPIFHTTNYDQCRLRFSGDLPSNLSSKIVVAEQGDILVARVDRNFHKKVAFVESGRAVITDCVYRVRLAKPSQEAVFEALRSPSGEAVLKAVSKGVSARLLGKADFLDLPLGGKRLQVIGKKILQEGESFPLLL